MEVHITGAQRERWEAAARKLKRRSRADWICFVCDEAAEATLNPRPATGQDIDPEKIKELIRAVLDDLGHAAADPKRKPRRPKPR